MRMKIDGINFTFADNGVIVEFSGQDNEDNWCSRKEVFPSWVVALDRAQTVYEARHTGEVFQPVDVQ